MVQDEAFHENCKVEGGEVVVKIGDTSHDIEGEVVEKPAEEANLETGEKVGVLFG